MQFEIFEDVIDILRSDSLDQRIFRLSVTLKFRNSDFAPPQRISQQGF